MTEPISSINANIENAYFKAGKEGFKTKIIEGVNLSEKLIEDTLMEVDFDDAESIEHQEFLDTFEYDKRTNNENCYQKDMVMNGQKVTEYSKMVEVQQDGKEEMFRAVTRQFEDGTTEKVAYSEDTIQINGREMPVKTLEETNFTVTIAEGNGEALLGAGHNVAAETILENATGVKWEAYALDKVPEGYELQHGEGDAPYYTKKIVDENGKEGTECLKYVKTATGETGTVVTRQFNDNSSTRTITLSPAPEPETPPTPVKPKPGGGGGGGGRVTPKDPDPTPGTDIEVNPNPDPDTPVTPDEPNPTPGDDNPIVDPDPDIPDPEPEKEDPKCDPLPEVESDYKADDNVTVVSDSGGETTAEEIKKEEE